MAEAIFDNRPQRMTNTKRAKSYIYIRNTNTGSTFAQRREDADHYWPSEGPNEPTTSMTMNTTQGKYLVVVGIEQSTDFDSRVLNSTSATLTSDNNNKKHIARSSEHQFKAYITHTLATIPCLLSPHSVLNKLNNSPNTKNSISLKAP